MLGIDDAGIETVGVVEVEMGMVPIVDDGKFPCVGIARISGGGTDTASVVDTERDGGVDIVKTSVVETG